MVRWIGYIRDIYHKIDWIYLLISLVLVGVSWWMAPYVNRMGMTYEALFLLGMLSTANILFPGPLWLAAFPLVGDPLLSALVFSLGSTLGELTGYMGGLSIREVLEKGKVGRMFRKYGGWAVFFLALIPNPFFDVVGLLAGSTKMPIERFLIAAFTGRFIRYVLIFMGVIGIKDWVTHG